VLELRISLQILWAVKAFLTLNYVIRLIRGVPELAASDFLETFRTLR